MSTANIDHAIGLIAKGLRMLATTGTHAHSAVSKKAAPQSPKNSDLFKPSGRLNESGIEFINSLFDQNLPKADIARRLGITYRAVQMRHDSWQAMKTAQAVERAERAARRRAARETKVMEPAAA